MAGRFPVEVPTSDMKVLLSYVTGTHTVPLGEVAESAWWVTGYVGGLVLTSSAPREAQPLALTTPELHQLLETELRGALECCEGGQKGFSAFDWKKILALLLQLLPTILG